MHAIKTNQSRASAKRRRKAVLAACSAVVFGLSCPALAAAANHVVTAMPNLTFSPKTLTINAGDTVTAALLVGLGDAGALGAGGDIAALADEAVRAILDHAAVAAAITCSREGAQPPTRAEVEADLI